MEQKSRPKDYNSNSTYTKQDTCNLPYKISPKIKPPTLNKNKTILKLKHLTNHKAKTMKQKRNYEFLEHTADAYIAAHGKNLTEAFENAALAMFNVITETKTVNSKIQDHVKVTAEDEQALLYNWLEDLLVKSEINQTLYSKFQILNLDKTPKGLSLKAKIWGEKYNPKKHPQKVGVKAITYHRMEIIKKPNRTTLKFILDI